MAVGPLTKREGVAVAAVGGGGRPAEDGRAHVDALPAALNNVGQQRHGVPDWPNQEAEPA